jgi:hypothetical protein
MNGFPAPRSTKLCASLSLNSAFPNAPKSTIPFPRNRSPVTRSSSSLMPMTICTPSLAAMPARSGIVHGNDRWEVDKYDDFFDMRYARAGECDFARVWPLQVGSME